MGEHVLRGREEAYKPAVRKQYRQFPTLGFTVHDLLLAPQRAALHFSEHGWSARTGTGAAWRGISLYTFVDGRIAECRVEQDYHARAAQLAAGIVAPVAPPAVDPWQAPPSPPAPGALDRVVAWLADGGPWRDRAVRFDDEDHAPPARVRLDLEGVEILDAFAAGTRCAFHVAAHGTYRGGPDAALQDRIGSQTTVYATGIAHVAPDGSIGADVVSDRLGTRRRLGG